MRGKKEKGKRRVKLRMNSQFHRGGDQEKRHSGMEQYIHSKRNGKLIRDLEKSVEQLVVVLNRIEKRQKKNESVMVVGTTPELGRMRERVCADVDSKKRIRVTRTWMSGMLTNYKTSKMMYCDSKEQKTKENRYQKNDGMIRIEKEERGLSDWMEAKKRGKERRKEGCQG